MNESPSAVSPSAAQPPVTPGGEKPLRRRWLLLARIGWIAAALAVLGLDVFATPDLFHQMQLACDGSQCLNNQLTRAQMDSFLAAGLPATFYATYILALYWFGILVYTAIAAAIFWRRPDDRMALLGAFTLLVFGAGTVFGPLTALPRDNPLWTQAISFASFAGATAFYVFFCIFPSGRFVPRWIQWVALAWVVGSVATVIPYALLQAFVQSPVFFVVPFGLLVFAQVYRYRRVSTPTQRQQTKWVVLGFAFGLGGFLVVLGTSNLAFGGGSSGTAASALFFITAQTMLLLLIPISIGIAILRSRLWDIDVIINRTLVYGSLTAILAVIYFSSVIGMQHLTRALTGQQAENNPLVIVLSTLLIAALFAPLRRRLQATIDRRFYRAKYNADRTLAAFGAALRSETDLSALSAHLVTTVEDTMHPAHVSLWLRPRQKGAAL